MGRTTTLFLLAFAIVSLYEVFTHDHEPGKHATVADDFEEFDEEKPKGSQMEMDNKISENFEDDDHLEIRPPTSSSPSQKVPLSFPPVKFSFCISCGYRQAFDQFSQILREKYPGIIITGENYAPSTLKSIAAQAIGFMKIILIFTVMMGRDPFAMAAMATPPFFTWILNNKLSSCLMLFLLSNSIESMLTSTGAFEIYLGDEKIWSKIESGRVPSPPELFQAIDSHIGLYDGFKGSLDSDSFLHETST